MRDIVLSIDVVEPGLVNAVHLLSKELARPLRGIALVHRSFLDYPKRPIDSTGMFKEVVVDFDDPDELQRAIKPFADQILLVTTRYEDAIHHFRQLIPFIPYLNTPTESSLTWSTEKPQMRDRLRAYDENLVPKYQRIEEKDMGRLEELTSDLAYPVIVKPGSLWSSFLVARCDTKDELRECLESTFKIINKVYGQLRRITKPAVLVEEFIDGDMYSTDVYVSQDGVVECLPLIHCVTAEAAGQQGFYTYRCVIPTQLSAEEEKQGYDAAKAAIYALNLRSTTAHIELFHTRNGWKIIELGARIGGARENLYRQAYGVEHHYNDLANRAGLKPKMPTKLVQYVQSENLYADEEGIIETIEGLEEARKLKSLLLLYVNAKPGDVALNSDKGGDMLIETVLGNQSKDQLEADAAKLREVIKFKVKPLQTDTK